MIFIDTGAFIARFIRNDQYHARAITLWNGLRREQLLTTNLIITETLTLLARQVGTEYAIEKAHLIYQASGIRVLRPDEDDEVKALDWLHKYRDQQLSFTDCVSFAVMKRHKIKRYFGFDGHFQLDGFHDIAMV